MAREDTFKREMSKDFANSFLSEKLNMETHNDEMGVPKGVDKETGEIIIETQVKELEASPIAKQGDDEVALVAEEEPVEGVGIDLSSLPVQEEKEEFVEPKREAVPKRRPSTTASKSKKVSIPDFMYKHETVNRTFVIRKDLTDALDNIFIDKNGKRIPGTRGMIGKIVTNGLIRELVEIGVLEESYLKEISEYN